MDTFFWLILTVVVGAAVMGATTTGEEERAAAAVELGEPLRVVVRLLVERRRQGPLEETIAQWAAGPIWRREKLAASGGDDSTFQDLPELSSGSRPTRLCQGTIFEMFEMERGCRRQSGQGTGMSIEEEELGSGDDEDDEDFDMEAEVPGEEEDEEDQEAEGEEQPAQVRRGVKRRRIHEGVGAAGWSILLGDGPLEGYRCRPAAMRHFHTIHGGQVDIDGLK